MYRLARTCSPVDFTRARGSSAHCCRRCCSRNAAVCSRWTRLTCAYTCHHVLLSCRELECSGQCGDKCSRDRSSVSALPLSISRSVFQPRCEQLHAMLAYSASLFPRPPAHVRWSPSAACCILEFSPVSRCFFPFLLQSELVARCALLFLAPLVLHTYGYVLVLSAISPSDYLKTKLYCGAGQQDNV